MEFGNFNPEFFNSELARRYSQIMDVKPKIRIVSP
jgi:hypothetical protein